MEGMAYFNNCPIMEQIYTRNSSHQNSWSLTVLPAQQVTTVIHYSSFIPGFYNINMVGSHTTNYCQYWKNKVAYTAFRRHLNELCMSELIWRLLYRYIYNSTPQFLNHRHSHSASHSLIKFHLKFQILFDARFTFPTLSNNKHHTHFWSHF